MKLSLHWLADFVDLPTSDPRQIADALESLGHGVDEIEVTEPGFTGVVIGKVLEVSAHPDADKVRLCRVDIGTEVSDIICGAWNFEAGATVAVAVPGAVLGGDFEIGRRKIRGIVSNGMICSETELGLGDESDGILVLDHQFPDAAERLGDDFASLLPYPDAVLTVEITPNRPDCMSVLGLARELAARFEVPVRYPENPLTPQPPESTVTIRIDDPSGCGRFVGREVRNITVGPSPLPMRMRLQAAGVRPINNVVDASNYTMIEMGHPTHAFDLARLGGEIVVRRAHPGETITTLDDQLRTLEPDDLVVADGEHPVAIAGVMGGAETEVQPDTTAVLIEAAYWQPPAVLMTSKRLGLRSEASARFERGADPNACATAADRVAQLLVATAGAEVVEGLIDVYPAIVEPMVLELPLSEIPRHLGIELDAPTATGLLERLGFGVSGADPLGVTVPTRRPDIRRPIDLIEELARLHGFDKIPGRVATGIGGGLSAAEQRLRTLRRLMAGAGYHEVLCFSFIGAADLDALGLPEGDPRRHGIRVVNPLRDEEGVMRTTLLPGLLKAAGSNAARRNRDVALFETGKVFIPGPAALPGEAELPDQPDHLAFVAIGRRHADWESPGRAVDVRDATGVWELIAARMGLAHTRVVSSSALPLHPGRAAEIHIGGVVAGTVGELHPTVASRFGLEGRVVVGEINLAAVLADRPHWQFRPPSQYPPVIFDLAFDVDEAVPAGSILDAIREGAGEDLEDIEVFDLFTGDQLGAGRKSLAVRLTLRSVDRTLTDDEMVPLRRRVVDAVAEATGGHLRGEA